MDESTAVKKVLKWAGIFALVALPLAMLLRKKKPASDSVDSEKGEYQSSGAELFE
jgi:hypothetical protein